MKQADFRLIILFYAGDMQRAYKLFKNSKKEEYANHGYMIEECSKIGEKIGEVIFFSCNTDSLYDEVLEPRLRAIGKPINPYTETGYLLEAIEQQHPTHLVVLFPIPKVISWAIRQKNLKLTCLFADSFCSKLSLSPRSLRKRFDHFWLAKLLNNSAVDFVANHGISASYSLQSIGVNPKKIIPWDMPHKIIPDKFPPKCLSYSVVNVSGLNSCNLVYVGSMTENKGVDDILNALVHLRHDGLIPKVTMIGSGNVAHYQAKVAQMELGLQVSFSGRLPHDQVVEEIRKADLAIVPSRHAYPEGLPLTIYEALGVRTPLIISDHPMFVNNFESGRDVLIFSEKDAYALAQCIKTLLTDNELYEKLSYNSTVAWSRLQLPVKWHHLLWQWIEDTPGNFENLFQHSLSNMSQKNARKAMIG